MKHTFALRLSLGDPEYVNVTAPQAALLSAEYMGQLQRASRAGWTLPLGWYGGAFNISSAPGAVVTDHGTSHVSTLDAWGNAVALTSTGYTSKLIELVICCGCASPTAVGSETF
jgi:gamma-glutamyltranspeptidase/glutathione hydrolase/leukotriene-C4 hydrolase